MPIEDIDVGDEVLAFDPTTGEEGPREVTDTITRDGQKTLVDITVTDTDSNTSTLTTTSEHPFWTPKTGQWVNATNLDPGTWLRTSSGTWTRVTATDTRTVANQQVHNLTVDDLHTYYVLAMGTPVLVHNSDPCPLKPLHPEGSLDKNALDYWNDQNTENIVSSLDPGKDEPLIVKPDGTIMNGNTRIAVLQSRGYDVDSLPRETYGDEKPTSDEDFWDMDQ